MHKNTHAKIQNEPSNRMHRESIYLERERGKTAAVITQLNCMKDK